jgi:hypothetical protein
MRLNQFQTIQINQTVWKFDFDKLFKEQFFNLLQQNILIRTIWSSIIFIWCAHKINIRDFFFKIFNTFNFFQFFKILIAWTGLISSLLPTWIDKIYSRNWSQWNVAVLRCGDETIDNKLSFKIFRKPTNTQRFIVNESHRSTQHKMAAFNSILSQWVQKTKKPN